MLVVSDVHQDLAWAKVVLEREAGNYDHVVFLGDWFDTHCSDDEVAGAEETAHFVKDIIAGLHGPATLLAGNHDAPYMEAFYHAASRNSHIPTPHNYCSGYSSSKARKIAEIFMWSDWRRFELFKLVNGRLLSHAGFLGDFWVPAESVEQNLAALYKESQEALENITLKSSRLFRCGACRGGGNYYGGPIWCDFEYEFVDQLPLGQVVGHTNRKQHPVRQVGQSYCIDGGQSSYALIQPDGAIEFKAIVQTAVSKLWVETPVVVQRQDNL